MPGQTRSRLGTCLSAERITPQSVTRSTLACVCAPAAVHIAGRQVLVAQAQDVRRPRPRVPALMRCRRSQERKLRCGSHHQCRWRRLSIPCCRGGGVDRCGAERGDDGWTTRRELPGRLCCTHPVGRCMRCQNRMCKIQNWIVANLRGRKGCGDKYGTLVQEGAVSKR